MYKLVQSLFSANFAKKSKLLPYVRAPSSLLSRYKSGLLEKTRSEDDAQLNFCVISVLSSAAVNYLAGADVALSVAMACNSSIALKTSSAFLVKVPCVVFATIGASAPAAPTTCATCQSVLAFCASPRVVAAALKVFSGHGTLSIVRN